MRFNAFPLCVPLLREIPMMNITKFISIKGNTQYQIRISKPLLPTKDKSPQAQYTKLDPL